MEDTEYITNKLGEMAFDGCFFTIDLLEKHGFYNETALTILFRTEGLDYISYDETVNALPHMKNRILSRRRKSIKSRSIFEKEELRNMYTPCELLGQVEEYAIILKQRKGHMPIADAIRLLNISKITLYRLLKKDHSSFIYGKYISVEDFNKIQALKVEYEPIAKAVKDLNVSKRTLYRWAKDKRIKTNKSRIAKEDIEQIKRHDLWLSQNNCVG